jgi:glycosyltransferase involved in cell wall biosynthesis
MNNLFFGSDFEALLNKTDLITPSRVDKIDLSIFVYFRQFNKDWLSFILHFLSLSEMSLEIILINDGGEVDINLPADDRLGLISNSETKGEVYCLKQALEISKGQYVKFLAYPDMLVPAGILHQVEKLKSENKNVCFGAAIFTRGEENEEIVAKTCKDLEDIICSDIKNVVLYKTAIFKKSILNKLIFHDYLTDDMYDDWIISLAGIQSKKRCWTSKDTVFIDDVSTLLNENPKLFDFFNMRRASIYAKGQVLAEYKYVTDKYEHIKIAIIDNNLNTGGAQWSILQWARLLPAQFHVKFLLYTEGSLVSKAKKDGLDIEIWDRQIPFEDWICERMKDWGADIVDVVWNGELLTDKVTYAAPVVVAHLQSQDIPWLDNLIAKKQVSRIDHLISVSESIAQKYSKLSDKIKTINSPVDAGKYLDLSSKRKTVRRMLGIKDTDFVVSWCGRILSSEKRSDLLRDVIQQVSSEGLDIKFVIGGVIDGNARDKDMYTLGWQKWCEDHDSVLILDLKPWEMDIFHSVGDVFLSLSDTEGLSLATLESLSSGCPVISTDVGGQSEAVISGITGALIEKGSSAQAVKTILDFYNASKSEDSKNVLNLMGYLGKSLISSECNTENIMRQHATMYMNWKDDGYK